MEQKIYNRQEMEERMPDFIFGRLNPEEKETFERSLSNYPDLQWEVQEVREVFNKLDELDLDAFLDRKTRNIPVRVSARLQQKKTALNIFARPGFVTIVAGIGVLLIAISLYFSKVPNKEPIVQPDVAKEVVENNGEPVFPQLKEIDALAEKENIDFSALPEVNNLSFFGIYERSFEPAGNILDELIQTQLLEFIPSNSKSLQNIFDNRIYDNLSQLDENDFQELIKELNNVEI